jgi:pimeloyl-ACP methyl ester carboxylesterase
LVLLHGFGGNGSLWSPLPGFRLILPDFRGHGSSAQPLDKDFYPPDVLADDGLALLEHLGFDDYDLGGYSLGARIVVRMLVRGARPRRAIVGGQGLREVQGIGGGAGAAFRKRMTEPNALVHVLDSLVATPVEALAGIPTPTLVVIGADDERVASGPQLADALPHGTYAEIPGNHGTAAAGPDLTATMLTWLT